MVVRTGKLSSNDFLSFIGICNGYIRSVDCCLIPGRRKSSNSDFDNGRYPRTMLLGVCITFRERSRAPWFVYMGNMSPINKAFLKRWPIPPLDTRNGWSNVSVHPYWTSESSEKLVLWVCLFVLGGGHIRVVCCIFQCQVYNVQLALTMLMLPAKVVLKATWDVAVLFCLVHQLIKVHP